MNDEEPTFRIRPATEDDVPQVRELVAAVLDEYGLQPDPDWGDADLEATQTVYGQPNGLFEVALDRQGEIVGVVGLFFLDHYRAELRKLYVARRSRKRGLGKTLLEKAMEHARTHGAMELWLETHSRCKQGIDLLTDHGFMPARADRMSTRADRVYAIRLQLARMQAEKPAAVPRRFGMGAILLLMVFFALVLGVMQACSLPPIWFATVFFYFVVVAVGQPLLFRGKKPRMSSFLVGMGAFFVCGLLPLIYYSFEDAGDWSMVILGAIGLAYGSVTLGGFVGYGTGCLLASVFFFADKLEGKGRRNRVASDASDEDVDPFAGEDNLPGDEGGPFDDERNPFTKD